ncbi:hypothetical protein ABMA28_012681 [Loxostege sticticalis]|uniref:Uncharacterized protein n=1 Tax=Loxostege sticticalis TaxID=481309 RepID=A0ABD0S4N4_LOXSC
MGRARTGLICAVPFCLSACFPGCGIRFHPFPNNVKRRNKWLKILEISPDAYKEDMMICCLHFNSADYFNNDRKKGKLKAMALPHYSQKQGPSDSNDFGISSAVIEKALEKFEGVSSSSDLDSSNDSDEEEDFSSDDECTEKVQLQKKQKPAKLKPKAAKNETKTDISTVDKIINEIFEENDSGDRILYEQEPEFTEPYNVLTHVCRICLATGCAMYSMNKYNLEPTYLLLTGIKSEMLHETKMPQVLCFECVRRLQNFIEFSTKSLTAWSLLNELIAEDKLSMDEIKGIDREKLMLSSRLCCTIYEPNYCDLKIQEYDEKEIEIFTNIDQNESLRNFEVTNEEHKESMENSFIKDETYLEMSVDAEDDAFINVKDEFEEHDTCVLVQPNENRLPIKNESPDKSEIPSENVYPIDKDEPSDSADDFLNSNENVTENTYPSKNAEDGSDDDLLCNSQNKKKLREFEELFEEKSLTTEMQKALVESRKNTKKYQNSVFKCDKCFKSFNLEGPFKEHMKRHTNECGEFVCPVCDTHYFTRFQMINHVRNHHEKCFQCRLCPYKTTFRSAVYTHKRSHDGKRYSCTKCSKSFAKPTPFWAHMQLYHPVDAVCHLCGASHSGFRNLDQHMRTAHRGEDLKLPDDSPCCDQCEIRFLDKSAIQRHFSVSPLHGNHQRPPKTHKKKLPGTVKIICEQCGVQCRGFKKYFWHFMSEHPGVNRTQHCGKFMCELCGNVLPTKSLLNEHLKKHADGNKPNVFVCTICGTKRCSKSGLSVHMRDHRVSRKCEICGRVLATVSSLYKHLALHKSNKPYSCEKCNKRFSMPSEKKAHITHAHMGVPWPKKRPRGSAPLRQRGGRLQPVADMTEKDQCAEQSDVT